MNYGFIAGAVSALLVSSALVTPAVADEVKLPSTIAWTAYNTGTTGYNQSVAIGKALKDKYGVSLRVVPGKNDISRLTPLRTGKVQFVANGGATYFASEGVSLFAARGAMDRSDPSPYTGQEAQEVK